MRWLRKLIPSFLSQFDDRLLTTKPWLWATRWHYHAWLLLLINVVLAALALLYPVHTHNVPDLQAIFGYLFTFQVIYVCFWLYQQVLFNDDRLYGERFLLKPQAEFWVRLFSLVLILSISYTPSWILNERYANSVTDTELQADMNLRAATDPYFPEGLSSFDHFRTEEEYRHHETYMWWKSYPLLSLEEVMTGWREKRELLWGEYDHIPVDSMPRQMADSMRTWQARIDSVQNRFERYYVEFVNFGGDTARFTSLLSDSLLMEQYIGYRKAPASEQLVLIEEAIAVREKYGRFIRASGQTIYAQFLEYNAPGILERPPTGADFTYESSLVDRDWDTSYADGQNLSRIYRAKKRLHIFLRADFFLGLLLGCFCLAGLLFTFRATHWKLFIAGVVTVIVLMILIGMSTELVSYQGLETLVYHEIYGLFWLAVVLSSWGIRKRDHSPVYETAWILVATALPFFAIFTLLYFDHHFDLFDMARFEVLSNDLSALHDNGVITYGQWEMESLRIDQMHDAAREFKQRVQMGVFVGGLLLYSLVLLSPIKWVYNRFQAKPRRR